MPMQYFASNNMCLYFQKSSDMLNKNTLGVKKVRGQSEAALQIGIMPMQYFASNNMCLYFQKSSDMLNKNTLGVKKVRGQSEAALQIGMCDQKL